MIAKFKGGNLFTKYYFSTLTGEDKSMSWTDAQLIAKTKFTIVLVVFT